MPTATQSAAAGQLTETNAAFSLEASDAFEGSGASADAVEVIGVGAGVVLVGVVLVGVVLVGVVLVGVALVGVVLVGVVLVGVVFVGVAGVEEPACVRLTDLLA